MQDSQFLHAIDQHPIVDNVWEFPQAARADILADQAEQLGHRAHLIEDGRDLSQAQVAQPFLLPILPVASCEEIGRSFRADDDGPFHVRSVRRALTTSPGTPAS